jgi:hypothetical protein
LANNSDRGRRGGLFDGGATALREQVGEAVETVKEYAAETAVAAREQAGIYAKSAGDAIESLAASATEVAARIGNGREAAAYARSQFDRVTGDEDFRLLGVAGLAVAAALGIAYERRATDESFAESP